jgi:hypothetical protein
MGQDRRMSGTGTATGAAPETGTGEMSGQEEKHRDKARNEKERLRRRTIKFRRRTKKK